MSIEKDKAIAYISTLLAAGANSNIIGYLLGILDKLTSIDFIMPILSFIILFLVQYPKIVEGLKLLIKHIKGK